MKIMNHEHPQWDEFLERLEGPEGCSFTRKNPDDVSSTTWKCSGGMNKDYAIAILKTIPDIDIEGSLAFFEDNGGHCDCEILFNVT